jgi:defect-in-organelle-trafficking protein DotC
MYKTPRKLVIFLFASLLLASGCASKKPAPPTSEIQGFTASPTDSVNISKIRLDALRETATGIGAQSGLYWESQRIDKVLDNDERNLDQIFNFRALLLDNNVLPPVLTEGRKALNLDSPETIRLADQVFKLESPPRFVTAPPTWREYLYMNYSPPEKPNSSLLPRNQEERDVWNEAVLQGWKDGTQQANSIFSANLGRLKRDFNGMILYRRLLAQNMVTPPYVARTDLGVTGDENQMRINDQVLRITATSKLVPDSKKWKSIVLPGTVGAVKIEGIEGTKVIE